MSTKAQWTFMVYLAGDNNLSSAGDRDLAEMRRIGSTPEVNVVVEFDNAGNNGTRRFHIQRDGLNERVEALGETDSGSPTTLLNFISWVADHYPAERYGLILWNHGGGWEPTEMDRIARAVNAPDYTMSEVQDRAASPLGQVFFRTTLETIFGLHTANDRAICSDDGSGHSLDTVELGRVLAQAVEKLGQPIDLLGMDACLMSNLEVAYQAQACARFIVASEEEEPNDGWPYDMLLAKLTENPNLSTGEFAAQIVEAYIKSYVDRNHPGVITQAALNLARINQLTAPLDRLAEALLADMPDAMQNIWEAQRQSTHFYKETLWDVAHFCEQLEQTTPHSPIGQAAQAVRAALQSGPENFVVAEAHHGAKVERCKGITIYLVPPPDSLSPYYAEVAYAQDHRWRAMLEAYHAV